MIIKTHPKKLPTESNNWLGKKREYRQLKRLRKKRKIKAKKGSNKVIHELYQSKVLDLLFQHNPYTSSKLRDFKPHIKVPKVFSIIEAPIDSIRTIHQLATIGRAKHLYSVYTDHSNMEKVDLAAESIFDYIALEIQKERKRPNKYVGFKGAYPKDQDLKRFLRAIGIIKNLDVQHEMLSKSEETDLRIFEMQSKYHSKTINLEGKLFKEKVSQKFVDHINECLSDHDRQLTHEARQLLSEYTGEIIDNSEEHSGMEQWAISGYLDNNHEDHICEISIFNFGKTIAQSFKDLSVNSFARSEIDPYIRKHARKGWFSKKWSADDLITLIALQGHISSKNLSIYDDRGQGTVQLIDFFQTVYNECTQKTKGAKMAILSGSTHILFDGNYQMTVNSDGRNVIAFNKENRLDLPPDANNVQNLQSIFFPGTIISIRFQMNQSQTEEIEQ